VDISIKSLSVVLESRYECIAWKWINNTKNYVVNMFTSTALWSLWKLRNYFVFQHGSWVGMDMVWSRLLPMIRQWRILCPTLQTDGFLSMLQQLEYTEEMWNAGEQIGRVITWDEAGSLSRCEAGGLLLCFASVPGETCEDENVCHVTFNSGFLLMQVGPGRCCPFTLKN
jgi:hypothetical protein